VKRAAKSARLLLKDHPAQIKPSICAGSAVADDPTLAKLHRVI